MAFVNLLQVVYPVGKVYISTVNISPASIVGGTWTSITDAALRAITPGTTNVGYVGSDTHTLTEAEMPKHYHNVVAKTDGYLFTGIRGVVSGSDISATTDWGPGLWTDWAGSSAAHSIVQRSYNLFAWVRTA